MKFAAALIATVAANRYENMNEDDLLVNLESTLSSALSSGPEVMLMPPSPRPLPSRTSRRPSPPESSRLDDGQPLVEVARKMKAIEGMQPQINDVERSLGIMQSVEPVLEN